MDYINEFNNLIILKQNTLKGVMNNKFVPRKDRQKVYDKLKNEIDILLYIKDTYIHN